MELLELSIGTNEVGVTGTLFFGEEEEDLLGAACAKETDWLREGVPAFELFCAIEAGRLGGFEALASLMAKEDFREAGVVASKAACCSTVLMI